jgi:hypothetical protein
VQRFLNVPDGCFGQGLAQLSNNAIVVVPVGAVMLARCKLRNLCKIDQLAFCIRAEKAPRRGKIIE